MKSKDVKLHANMTIAELNQLGDQAVILYDRDVDVFLDYGMGEDKRNTLQTKVTELKSFKLDKDFVIEISIISDRKNKTSEEIRVELRSLLRRAKNAYGENSLEVKWFYIKDLSRVTGENLLREAKWALDNAVERQAALEPYGVSQDFLDNLSDKITSLDNDIDLFGKTEKERDITTEKRNELANEVYARIKELFACGKEHWISRDEAKYNDYIIYEQAGSTPEEKTKIASQERLVVIEEHILADAELSIVNTGIAELTFWVSEQIDSKVPHNAIKLPSNEKTKVDANLISDGTYGMLLVFNGSSDEGEFNAGKL